VHDHYERHERAGHNADAVYDFNGHGSGTGRCSGFDHDLHDAVDDDLCAVNHNDDGCFDDNLHDPPDG
jgi:hypothetical protein